MSANHKRKKITVIGAGFVGSTAAHWAAQKELGDIVLLDINEGAAKGKALDLFEASPVEMFDSRIQGTADYKDIEHSDIVILTAGLPRKPGMSRDDLLLTNAKIVKACCEGIKQYAPNSVVIVVSNPLDAMCTVAKQVLGFPRERIIGMAGVLDSARFRSFVAEALDVSVKDVFGFTLGGHGDTMVPMPRHCFVGGVPLVEMLPQDKIVRAPEQILQVEFQRFEFDYASSHRAHDQCKPPRFFLDARRKNSSPSMKKQRAQL